MSRASLSCAEAIFNIRKRLQDYRKSKPPEMHFYEVSEKDLLEMLDMTMMAWNSLEAIEEEKRQLISGLLDAVKK